MDLTDITNLEREIRDLELEALVQYQKGTQDAPLLYQPTMSEVTKAKDSDGNMVFIASEESPDRRGDVVLASGWQLKDFRKNPVFMYSHDLRIPPIGNVSNIAVEGTQLIASVVWDEEDEFATAIRGKYERHIMRGVSVGFRPIDFRFEDDGIRFLKQELIELSAVAVPMHPKALQKMLGDQKFSIVVPERINPSTLSSTSTATSVPDIRTTEQKILDSLTRLEVDISDIKEAIDYQGKNVEVDDGFTPGPDPKPNPEPEPVPAENDNEDTIDEDGRETLLEALRSLKEDYIPSQ
jgi:hypothetical protein